MPGTRKPQYANDFNKADMLQLLLALQGKVNRELHVATLCVIDSVIDNHTCRAFAFPKAPGKDAATLNVLVLRQSDMKTIQENKHCVAVVLMTDLDSRANYELILNKKAYEAAESDSTLHSLNNAVLVYLGGPLDEEVQ